MIWIYVRLCQSQKPYINKIGWILTGFLLSLGVWNHVIFLPSAVSLVICYAIFMWPGFRRFLINGIFCLLGFLIGLVPRFISALVFGNVLFQKRPAIPPASLKTSLLNLLYTLSGDGLYARFSGKSIIPFAWGILGIVIVILVTFCFLKDGKKEKKLFWGIWVFLVFNFIGIWRITPFGSMGSRLWLIPVWIFSGSARGMDDGPSCMEVAYYWWHHDFYKSDATCSELLYTEQPFEWCYQPSVYVGGKYDNTWDYYDHRQVVEKLAQTDAESVFISNINVFTFYYLMPKEQRHRIKLLWSLEQGGMGSTPEKQQLYSRFSYKGPIPKSALFVFYDNDKDYLDHFSKQWYFPLTTPDNDTSLTGFKVFRLK